jgi:diguanylate cyclase (GGDEF)-like protein
MKWFVSARRAYSDELGAEGICDIDRTIDIANWRRLRYFFGLTMAYEILLVLMVDLPALSAARAGAVRVGPGSPIGAGETPAVPLAFMACHVGIFLCSTLGLLASFRSLAAERSTDRRERIGSGNARLPAIPTLAPGLFAMAILLILGAITGLDQLRGGDINAFAINIVVAAVLIYIRPPLGFLVFTPGFVAMFVGVFLLQRDPELRLANLINGGIFFSAVLLLSWYLYDNQFIQLAKSSLLERASARIKELSARDELTGLFNRRALVEVAERDLSRMRREGRRSFLAIADVDHFKNLNDSHGHPAGDAMLRLVAAALVDSTREADAVARWGGEEFLLLIEGGSADTARQVLERARRSVESALLERDGNAIRCTLSFGFAEIPVAEDDAFAKAYHEADAALYAAKQGGRNRVEGPNGEG